MQTTLTPRTSPSKWPVDGTSFVTRRQFAARTIGGRVSRHESRGHVGAVFKHTCILLLDGGGVIALLAPHVGHVAHGVRLARNEPIDRCFRIGMPMRICGGDIVFGTHLAVTLSSAQMWTSALRLGLCEWTGSAFGAMTRVRNRLLELAPTSGSEFLTVTLQMSQPVTALGARVSTVLPRLAFVARQHDADGALLVLRELIGLGPGLTPAGDDFMIGWLAGLTLAAQSPPERKFLAAMCTGIEALSRATTPISRQHLGDACGLMFSERLSAVCVAIATGASAPVVDASVDAQLAVGATSGADAAAGVLFALFESGSGAPLLRVIR
jgi:hypothetical protein